jgi:hypothetical protein
MSTNPRFPLLSLAALVLCIGAGSACAQSAGPDEAVGPNGIATQQLALTPVQRTAIYNSVMRQRVPSSSRGIIATIGAPVPPSATLLDLPDQNLPDQTAGGGEGSFLKYAMVEDDVVVVDPIAMRVVDVIHPGAVP